MFALYYKILISFTHMILLIRIYRSQRNGARGQTMFYQNHKGESLLKTGRLVILTALCGALIPGYAIAQALEEIVVTARKRSESLQEIPESITSHVKHSSLRWPISTRLTILAVVYPT